MSKSFRELNKAPNGENLLVVDGLNLAFRFKHANKKEFSSEFLITVRSLAKSYNCKNVVVLGDGGSEFRYSIFPEYKANRQKLRESQTEEERQDFEDFLKEFSKCLELCSKLYLPIRLKGVEADDIAAYIVKKYTNIYEHIWLISSDRDWDLLISKAVSRFSTHQRKEITLDNWNTHYAYLPEEHISIKVLQGDKGDNIPGVDGIGEKRAYNLVKQYGSALDIYDQIPINDKRKFVANLNEFKDKIHLNYMLMDLLSFCEDNIGLEHLNYLDEKLGEYLN